jgi:hypothetical protein
LSATANNALRAYGAGNPVFTGTVLGLVNGDNITGAYSCSARAGSPVGTYAIIAALADPGHRRTNYAVSLVNGTLTVTQAVPRITWSNPARITYGAALTSKQLNAAAKVAGSFAYKPSAGTVLNVGTNILSVVFTPTDTVDYSSATDSVNLVVWIARNRATEGATLLASSAGIPLNIHLADNAVVLSWNDPASAFALQAAPATTGVFTNVPGAASPYTNAITGTQLFFRLLAP